jgi:hypothetical protein
LFNLLGASPDFFAVRRSSMIATTGRGYIDDQERRYGHVRHFVEDDYDQAIAAVEELFAWNPRERGQQARERLLEDKIDVTRWMVDYFECTFSGSS